MAKLIRSLFSLAVVPALLLASMLCATAGAQTGEPKVHLPQDLKADEIVHVIVTEPGLADQQGDVQMLCHQVCCVA